MLDAARVPAHRAKNLYLVHRIEAIPLRQFLADKLLDQMLRVLGRRRTEQIKLAFRIQHLFACGHNRILAGIDAVRVLDNQALLEGTCAECHENLIKQVSEIQEEAERRTYAIGYALEALTEKLVLAVESGNYTEEELNAIRAVARDAQFYWDFVFVENSEGAHNSRLTNECLDKAEQLIDEALAKLV